MSRRRNLFVFMVAALVAVAVYLGLRDTGSATIVYGISLYQDTILPVVAEQQGWYEAEGLDVQLRVLPWGDVMSAVAAGAVDVAIQNFNSFQATYHNIVDRGGDVVFYCSLYVFKGAAIMTWPERGIATLKENLENQPAREEAIQATVAQLRGKRIAVTRGTEMEQVVLAALRRAGLEDERDVTIIHAQPDDGLRAFLARDVDFYSGGLTERTEAVRNGAAVLIEASDVSPPVIDGLVTSKEFASSHSAELQTLANLWFRTIRYLEEDLDTRAVPVIDRLAREGSTRYSVDEYKFTWFNTQVYPKTAGELQEMMLAPDASYYWKRAWNENNSFLMAAGQIPRPVPLEAASIENAHRAYLERFGANE